MTSQSKRKLLQLANFGKISSGLFHDLINPLTSLMLEVDTIKSSPTTTKKQISSLSKSCDLLQQYINNVRNALNNKTLATTFNIYSEINVAAKLLLHKVKKHTITLENRVDSNLIFTANSFSFQRVLINLLSNAIDSFQYNNSMNKKIVISSSITKKYIKLAITDFGCGIDKDTIKKIFSRFYSTKNSSGIGLSICKEIIENEFKGKITVKSKRLVGSTFTIHLPINS